MNPVIKAQLSEFTRSNGGELTSESEYFEVFSIFAVENGMLGNNIAPFRAHLRGDEFGVDGIATLVQGSLCVDADEVDDVLSIGKNHTCEFHFFQSKTSEKLDYGAVSKFLDGVYDFFTGPNLLSGKQVDELIVAKDRVYEASTKNNPILQCFFCLTGTGDVSKEIAALIEAGRARLSGLNIFSEVIFEVLGAKRLQEGYRSATNSTSATFYFEKSLTLPGHEKVDEAHIGYITADQLLEIALNEPDAAGNRTINRSVFYDNVRDFNPDSEINKSIVGELLAGDVSSFVFKNNGVTVVAKSIKRKGNSFALEDYQIVNGCQTTNILGLVSEHAAKISVPFRLIGSHDQDFVSSIIVGTNKQNEVREDQFWALLPFMKDLEEYCAAQPDDARILIERRDNQYRGIAVERTRIIKPSDVMKAVAAMYFFQPHRAARDHRGIRKEFSDRIFQAKHNVELYHLAGLAFYKFDYLVRTGRVDRSNSIYKYYCLFSLIRKYWATPNLLEVSIKEQSKVKSSVSEVVRDAEAFIEHILKVAAELTKLAGTAERSREQVRDFIRTDTVQEAFSLKFFSHNKK